MESFKKRIEFDGSTKDIALEICKDYNLGEFKSSKLVLCGYEDYNFILETTKKEYFVKVFASFRDQKNCERYVNIMTKAIEANVAIPNLYASDQGYLYEKIIDGTNIRLCVMEHVEGKTFYELGRKLNPEEIKSIARQTALINSIDLKPEAIYDPWTITHFLKEYNMKKEHLKPHDIEMIDPLVKEFKDMNIESLPHCFVHGDILTTNVIKDKEDKLWIIDFSISSYYPRIQDLAVISCNLLLDKRGWKPTKEKINILLSEYQKTTPLTKRELEVFPTYLKLAHAMHIICASYEESAKNNHSDENKYWLNEGRTGLEQMVN
jgi:Ser/Thr protein kinase RdoA (MazF antagonist)